MAFLCKCLATRDPAKKKRRRWVDAVLEHDFANSMLRLHETDDKGIKIRVLATLTSKKQDMTLDAGEEVAFENGWICEIEEIISVKEPRQEGLLSGSGATALRPTPVLALPESRPEAVQLFSDSHLPGDDVYLDDENLIENTSSERLISKRVRTDEEILAMLLGPSCDNESKGRLTIRAAYASTDIDSGEVSLPRPLPYIARTKHPVSTSRRMSPKKTLQSFESSGQIQRSPPFAQRNGREIAISFSQANEQQDDDFAVKIRTPTTTDTMSQKTTKSTLSSFLRPVVKASYSNDCESSKTLPLHPPIRLASNGPLRRIVTLPPVFSSLKAYSASMTSAWAEELQAIINTQQQSSSILSLKDASLFVSKGSPQRFYLSSPGELTNTANKKKLQMGDIWILSISESQYLFESLWFGASFDGRIELRPLGATPALPLFQKSYLRTNSEFTKHQRFPNQTSISLASAKLGPCLRTELSTLRLLMDFDTLSAVYEESDSFRDLTNFSHPENLTTMVQREILADGVSDRKQGNKYQDPRLFVSGGVKVLEAAYIRVGLQLGFQPTSAQRQVIDSVIQRCVRITEADEDDRECASKPMFVAVHGPFGSGKSQTIAFCCRLLYELVGDQEQARFRIGIAAATNVAVDRVLLELLKRVSDPITNSRVDEADTDSPNVLDAMDDDGDCNLAKHVSGKTVATQSQPMIHPWTKKCIARIGSVRNTNRALLPRMIHVSSVALSDAKHELARLTTAKHPEPLRNCNPSRDSTTPMADAIGLDETFVQEALSEVHSACDIARESFVVGVTCCSSGNKEEMELAFGGKGEDDGPLRRNFNLVFIDEASQIFEPVALMPIINSTAQVVCAFGDPHQLPPVSPFAISTPVSNDLGSTLFGRMSKISKGTPWEQSTLITLDKSFRCHPDICSLASSLFYQNRVLSGLAPCDRPALVNGLGPITFLEVRDGSEFKTAGGSYSNDAEAILIVRIIMDLLRIGISSSQITIATMFVAQSERLQARLATTKVRVATVDALQGCETDFVFISTVRTDRMTKFSEQRERVNVLLTRAKNHLIILGVRSVLEASDLWKQIIRRASPFRMNA